MKKCLRCNIEKDETLFCKDKRKKSGITAECKECYNNIRKEYISENRERTRKNYKKYYDKNNERIREHNRKKTVKYREKNRDRINAYSNYWYQKNAEIIRKRALEYAKKPEYVEKRKKARKKYREKTESVFKNKSRKFFELAIKKGFLMRGIKCEICGKEGKTEGHHKDYSKPLEVQWLCKICHMNQHGKLLDMAPKT